MKAKDIMTRAVVTVEENQSAKEVKNILRKNNINGGPVLNEEGEIVGVITVNDLLEAFAADREEEPIENFMSKNVVTADVNSGVLSVFKSMRDKHIHRVIIEKDGQLAGVVSTTDAYRALLKIVDNPDLIKKIFADMM
ncbi:MAG: CBS domain-containing protein [Elusimicrobiota bacterium]